MVHDTHMRRKRSKLVSDSSSCSSSVDQLDAGHRPLCPIHCAVNSYFN